MKDDDEEADDQSQEEEDEMEQARCILLKGLEDLRPVTLKDFLNAMDFILEQTSPEEAEALLSPDTRNSLQPAPRYDSSSSSSSDDEEGQGDGEDDEAGAIAEQQRYPHPGQQILSPMLGDR